MTYTELFTRNNLENMALFSGIEPPGGFTTFDPSIAASAQGPCDKVLDLPWFTHTEEGEALVGALPLFCVRFFL